MVIVLDGVGGEMQEDELKNEMQLGETNGMYKVPLFAPPSTQCRAMGVSVVLFPVGGVECWYLRTIECWLPHCW